MTPLIRLAPAGGLRRWFAAGTTAVVVILGGVAGMSAASAAQSSVGLGAATPFAVLAGTTVTNTGPSRVSGDLGVSPGTAVTGFPPGLVTNGTRHAGDAVALKAQTDLTAAYNDAAGRTPATVVSADLGGRTLAPGVYKAASALGLTGTVTLITASSSRVRLIGGASPCNVFWQVGSSATLGTNTTFVGSILALTSATVQTGTTVAGRVLARNGQVSLHTNTITRATCNTPTPTPTTIIPSGHPETGAGGASHSGDSALVALGGLILVGAGVAMGQAIRRRRVLPARDGLSGDE